MLAHYSRKAVASERVRAVYKEPPPSQACVWICWHESNLVATAYHHLFRGRPGTAFVPTGLGGTCMRGWLDTMGLIPNPIEDDQDMISALRRMRRSLRQGIDVLIAVDGPFGPRKQVKPGALWLAASARAPVRPFGCAAVPSLRLPRWDRHLVPLPGSDIAVVLGETLQFTGDPRNGDTARQVERTLNDLVADAAEQLAHSDVVTEAG